MSVTEQSEVDGSAEGSQKFKLTSGTFLIFSNFMELHRQTIAEFS